MIIELENTFARLEGYNCFACGPDHPFGLKLKFFYDDHRHEVFTHFHSNTLFAGFPGILHGGIQATILDEIAFWGAWARHGKPGFTFDMKTRYRKKCPVDCILEARGEIGEIRRRLVTSEVRLQDPESGQLFTQGTVRYFLPDDDGS